MGDISITAKDGMLQLRTPYSPELVADLKARIPSEDRRWDNYNRVWLIAPQYAKVLERLIVDRFGLWLSAPKIAAAQEKLTRLVEMRYLGAAKDRGGDEPTAFGYSNGDWSLVFALSVLRRWFGEDADAATTATTLYAVLGVPKSATQDEIKSAYRRAARTYHPDVCKEPDAKEQFIRIRQAWEVLSDPDKRLKYNAGLVLEASITRKHESPFASKAMQDAPAWRPPLRCGWLLVEGITVLDRLNVLKIIQWADITRSDGAVPVTSWPQGADNFIEKWVNQ